MQCIICKKTDVDPFPHSPKMYALERPIGDFLDAVSRKFNVIPVPKDETLVKATPICSCCLANLGEKDDDLKPLFNNSSNKNKITQEVAKYKAQRLEDLVNTK
ncbi:hypothetical protein COJ48_24835 [Bacillus cereus]|nr:hypothetical protein COJ48_24835 [Bacillus cereus]PGP86674.1 hypothetical protein CN997_05945 [Bacillus cereus]